MADNDQLLKKIGNLIDQKIEPINNRLDGLEKGQAQTNKDTAILKDGQAHNTTMLEAVLAGQQELQKTAAREESVMNLGARLTRKVNDFEERITELEKEEGIPHPHKH